MSTVQPGSHPTAAHQPLDPARPWIEEDGEQLPPRPRRRLLGKGANPLALALLGVLVCACGFIGGVLVEKGQGGEGSSSAGAAASLASRFAALRGAGAAGRSGTGSGTTGTAGSSAGGSGAGGPAGLFGGGARRPTAGTVAYLDGSTLYVTNAEGNTVKITTSPATSVSKTVKANVGAIHPGETVTVVGSTGSSGAVSAESISVGAGGALGGGALSALFGGGRGGARGGESSASGKSGSASGSGGEPALFGNGG